jgi:Tripartite tricarboxylate transporter family receptor
MTAFRRHVRFAHGSGRPSTPIERRLWIRLGSDWEAASCPLCLWKQTSLHAQGTSASGQKATSAGDRGLSDLGQERQRSAEIEPPEDPIIAMVRMSAIIEMLAHASERIARRRREVSMNSPRREFLKLATGTSALLVVSHTAWTQAYPTRPVRWVVGFAPAGGNDIVARLMSQWLSERTGQQFVVEKRPGAGTNIATEIVVNAPPDGYTLLLVGVSAAINATLYDNLNFNFIRDIAPAAGIMGIPLLMATNLSVPAKTVPEFIAFGVATMPVASPRPERQ